MPSPSSHSDSEEEQALPPTANHVDADVEELLSVAPQNATHDATHDATQDASQDATHDTPSTEEKSPNETSPSDVDPNAPHFINNFIPLNDNNEFYDLEDAARYFSRQNEVRICRICGNPGHISRNCPQAAAAANICFFCAQPTHNSRSCPFVVCRRLLFYLSFIHSCHHPGHETNTCPEKSVPPFCRYCSSRLHLAEVVLSLQSSAQNCPIIPHPYDKAVFQLMHCVCCGKQGHLVCKSQPSLSKAHGGRCAVCGSANHSYLQCPSRGPHRTAHVSSQENNGACFICGKMVGEGEGVERRVILPPSVL